MTKKRLLMLATGLLGGWFISKRRRRLDIKTVTFGPTTTVTTHGE